MAPIEAAYKKMAAHQWLVQWGIWLHDGNRISIGRTMHPLARLMGDAGGAGVFREANEPQAMAVQEVWAHMVAEGKNWELTRFRRQTYALYAFVLKLDYIEDRWTRKEMVSHIAAKYHRPKYNERSLLNNLSGAVGYVGHRLGIGT